MKVLELNCNKCGAALEVPPKTRFVTCTFCGTRLQIQADGPAAYTETLEEIADDVKAIRRSTEAQELDSEWAAQREGLLTHGRDGETSAPSFAVGILIMVVPSVFGVFWISFARSIGAPGFFIAFGVLFVLTAIIMGGLTIQKASDYSKARADYERKRRDLRSE